MNPPEGQFDVTTLHPDWWRITPWDGDGPVTPLDRLLDRLDHILPGWQTALELGLFAAYLLVVLVEFAEHVG